MTKALQDTCVSLDGRPMGKVKRVHGAFLYPLKNHELKTAHLPDR